MNTTTPTQLALLDEPEVPRQELALTKKYGLLTRELIIIEMCRAARPDWNLVKDISQGSMNQLGITPQERAEIEHMMSQVFDTVLAPHVPHEPTP